jgi:hypothetical protein
LQAFEIETVDDAGIGPKDIYELASQQVGGSINLGYTCRDLKNHLRAKRQKEMMYGEAGSMLKYFQEKIAENSLFHYALQLDCEEQITNIFWANAKMIIDYAHFGDVVTFDTTFGTNKEYRSFDVFVGLIILEIPSFLEQLFYMIKHLTPLNGSLTHFLRYIIRNNQEQSSYIRILQWERQFRWCLLMHGMDCALFI